MRLCTLHPRSPSTHDKTRCCGEPPACPQLRSPTKEETGWWRRCTAPADGSNNGALFEICCLSHRLPFKLVNAAVVLLEFNFSPDLTQPDECSYSPVRCQSLVTAVRLIWSPIRGDAEDADSRHRAALINISYHTCWGGQFASPAHTKSRTGSLSSMDQIHS